MIAGLAVGITASLIIGIYIQSENNYDSFFKSSDDIYRITFINGAEEHRAISPSALAVHLKNDIPQIEEAVRFAIPVSRRDPLYIHKGETGFYEANVFFVDSNFLKVFDFKLLAGNPVTALNTPNSIIITKSIAQKYFGNENAIGQTLSLETEGELKITAVAEDPPRNTHLKFDFLIPHQFLGGPSNYMWQYWDVYTYVKLKSGTNPQIISDAIPKVIKKYSGANYSALWDENVYPLQNIRDIHFSDAIISDLEPSISKTQLFIFLLVAVFIFLLACINYINLSTSRSAERFKEIGIYKVLGASRKELINKLLGESIALSFISIVLSVLILELSLPVVNNFFEINLEANYSTNSTLLIAHIFIFLFIGIAAGFYPAVMLSGKKSLNSLRNAYSSHSQGSFIRKSLVVFQFAVSIILVICTIIVKQQLNFMQETELGFQKENTLLIKLRGEAQQNYEQIKTALLQNSNVKSVSAATNVLGSQTATLLFYPDGMTEGDERSIANFVGVDFDFINSMGIEILEGRNFSRENITDFRGGFIINEAALRKFEIEEPIGKNLRMMNYVNGRIIGVIKNFNYASLETAVEPLVIGLIPSGYRYMYLKLNKVSNSSIEEIKETWLSFSNDYPFDFFFLNDHLNSLYKQQQLLQKIVNAFSAVALVIACIGLLGLTAYSAEQKTKEIGIRKVFGASSSNISFMLSKGFLKLVILANVIAIPVSIYLMQNWLEGFAYRTELNVIPFAAALSASVFITLFTVSLQSLKAANANPVDSLKHE